MKRIKQPKPWRGEEVAEVAGKATELKNYYHKDTKVTEDRKNSEYGSSALFESNS